MKKIGIYKITSPTNRVYIGQSIDIELRWIKHKLVGKKSHPKLYDSIQEYGLEIHKFEIIEECLESQLDEREEFYKQQFINNFGWDLALFCHIKDGKGGRKSEETKQKMRKAQLGKIKSQEIKDKIRNSKLNKSHNHGYKIGNANRGKGVSKSIIQYDLQGNFIKEWVSFTEASKGTNLCIGSINKAALGKNRTCGGYLWRYKSDKSIVKIRKCKHIKNIIQYDLDMNLIKEWDSITEASIGLKCSVSIISACLIGKYKTAKKFIFKYK